MAQTQVEQTAAKTDKDVDITIWTPAGIGHEFTVKTLRLAASRVCRVTCRRGSRRQGGASGGANAAWRARRRTIITWE